MSNEELAVKIQSGNTELIIVLWERINKLINMLCGKYFCIHEEQCTKAGVELNDLEQEGYFVMLKAVAAYKRDKDFKFNSYLRFAMKNHFNEFVGYRTAKGRKDILTNALSLEKPIVSDGEGNVTTLGDSLEDDTLQGVNEDLEREDLKRLLWGAVDKLPEKLSSIIIQRYKFDKTLRTIAEEQGTSHERIRQLETTGIVKLKSDRGFKQSIEDYIPTRHISLSEYKTTFTSATEWAVLWREQHPRH